MKMIKHPFAQRVTPEHDIGYDYRRKVGNRIREWREATGMTQRELGQAVDVTNNAISAIELGRNPIPPERYRAFAEALQVDPVVFGEFLQEYTDPWLWELLHGAKAARKHNLPTIQSRLSGRD